MKSPDHDSPITNHKSPYLLADCHLHFEGCASTRDARTASLVAPLIPFPTSRRSKPRRRSVHDEAGFLLSSPKSAVFSGARRITARRPREVGESLAAGRRGRTPRSTFLRRSFPEWGSIPGACLTAVDEVFREGGRAACDCRILLDVVRHWGPESAERVLDLHEKKRGSPPSSDLGWGATRPPCRRRNSRAFTRGRGRSA